MKNEVKYPTIPTNVVVHLGNPDEAARNITIPFIEYIKNVASSEIYPSWPINAIKANIYAEVSFALNRIYNEWYKSKGYNFDLTNTKTYDQTFIEDREIFDNIGKIVDELFDNYIVKEGQIQPFFAQYCDGKNTKCDGLSQWGSVELANQNKSPLDILKTYYGDNIKIVTSTMIGDNIESYPGLDLQLGDAGDMVRTVQRELNRISKNYSLIPEIPLESGVYDIKTENAIKKFQEIFDLKITGIVDKATWYKLKYIYNAVKKINDLYSEGIQINEAKIRHYNKLRYSDTGIYIRVLHYYLSVIAYFDSDIELLKVNGIYNDNTKSMVMSFQKKYKLPVTGEVDANTWKKLREVYNNTIENIPDEYLKYENEFYPGKFLSKGMTGEDITNLQKFLLKICRKSKIIPGVKVNGIFDELTEKSIMKMQEIFDQEPNGAVGPITWYNIVEYSKKD